MRPDGSPLRIAIAAALFALGCSTRLHAPTPVTPPPPPAPLVPAGCEANLSGDYTHVQSGRYRYRGEDDGGTLLLSLMRPLPDGGGAEGPDAGTKVLLSRTPEGFLGATHAYAYAPGGTLCAVDFRTELLECDDAGLILLSEERTAVDEASCLPSLAQPRRVLLEHRLLREHPAPRLAPPDGGAADAGAP